MSSCLVFRIRHVMLQGFDVVRTEVGLENEIYLSDRRSGTASAGPGGVVAGTGGGGGNGSAAPGREEPYRRRDGSTELEGMYSGGDATPEKHAVSTVSPPAPNKRVKYEANLCSRLVPVHFSNMRGVLAHSITATTI